MAEKSDEKKSFKLYNSYSKQFEKLDDCSAGQLIKAIFAYVNNQETQPLDNLGADMAFSFICSQLDRDKVAYDKKCEVNRKNGGLGGRPKKENQTDNKKPNGFSENQTVFEKTEQQDEEPAEAQPQERRRIEYPASFERFWEIYPRKEGKGECYKKFHARVNDGYSEDELCRAAQKYADQIRSKHTEARYIKHGKTFLSDSMPFLDFLKPQDQETPPTAPHRSPTDNIFSN